MRETTRLGLGDVHEKRLATDVGAITVSDGSRTAGFSWSGLLHILSSNVGANVAGFASGVVMARVLGPEGRGLYQTGALLWALVPGILSLSLGTAVAISVRRPPRAWYLKTSAILTVAGMLIFWALYCVGLIPMWMAIVFSSTALGFMTSDLVQGALRRSERYGALAAFRWIDVGGGAAVVVLLAAFGSLTPITAVIALCSTTLVAVAVSTLQLARSQDVDSTSQFRWDGVASIHSGTILRIFSSWTDQLLIAALLGPAALGLYAIANAVATQFLVLPAAVNTVLLRQAHVSAERGLSALKSFTGALFWTALLASSVFFVFGHIFFGLIFGEAFSSSGRIAAGLVFASLFAGLLLMAETYLIARGDARFAASARLWSVPALLVSGTILAVTRDLTLAVIVPISANVVPFILILLRISKTTRTPIYSFFTLPSIRTMRVLATRAKPRNNNDHVSL